MHVFACKEENRFTVLLNKRDFRESPNKFSNQQKINIITDWQSVVLRCRVNVFILCFASCRLGTRQKCKFCTEIMSPCTCVVYSSRLRPD